MSTVVLCTRCGAPLSLTADLNAALALGLFEPACAPRCGATDPPAHITRSDDG